MSTTRWVNAQTDQVSAVDYAMDVANAALIGPLTSDATGALTLTVAQLLNGTFVETGTAAAGNIATPTAAAIVAAIVNCQVGASFDFAFVNTGSNTMTITAGTGVTLTGTHAMATNTSQLFRGIVTNATVGSEAVTLVGLLHTAS